MCSYTNTTACTSTVSYIDGDAGILRYRGVPIEQLAESSSFLETSYLVVYGHLPTADQMYRWEVRAHALYICLHVCTWS